jgi:hypothetical protein
MTKTHTVTRQSLKQWVDMGDIFYMKKDKLNFLSSLNALVNEHLGLVVVSQTPALLNYYSRMLVARLRKIKGIKLEVFLPATTDGLLKKFNDLLANMSLEQAKNQPVDDASFNIMIVHDANSVAEEQWVLLTRLMADFPGVNLRLVLFLDERLAGEHDSLISRIGKDLHRWTILPPTPDQLQELLQVSEENGYQSEAKKLLKAIDLMVDTSQDRAQSRSLIVEPISPLNEPLPITEHNTSGEVSLEDNTGSDSNDSSKLNVIWVLVFFTAAFASAWVISQALGIELTPSLLSVF